MFSGSDNFLTRCVFGGLALTLALLLPPGTTFSAQDVSPVLAVQSRGAGELSLPAEFGEIIYRINPHALQQIYIIGQSHRSALSGQAGSDLLEVQTEIYRIGEWLILENNLELLLPEGFFQEAANGNVSPREIPRENVRLDNRTLKARLSDTRRFVNADLLLNASYDIPLGQVENKQLYREIRRLLQQAREENSFLVLSELNDLQDERTAAMLQNIPDTVEEAYRNGRIGNRRAMFTIGLGHVREIIDNLQRGTLPSPVQNDLKTGKGNEPGLKLLDQGYGVTVIIPRTLAENQRILRFARLHFERG
jgi:hypothetical protein